MKKFLPVFVLTLLLNNLVSAQHPYEVLVERPNEKSYKGFISREVLLADSTFKWYAPNKNAFKPQPAAVEALQKNKDSIQLLVFMGTWCEDSQSIIPKLYSLMETAGFSNDRITLLGVDRNKKTYSHLAEALNIRFVPTIIVMKNGKEQGRIVEYGKSGMFDKDLAQIINSSN